MKGKVRQPGTCEAFLRHSDGSFGILKNAFFHGRFLGVGEGGHGSTLNVLTGYPQLPQVAQADARSRWVSV